MVSDLMYILRILVVEEWSKFSLQTTSTFKQTVQDSSLYAPWYFLKSFPVQKYQKSMLKQASLQLTGCVTSPWYLSLCTLGIFNEFSVIDQLIISFTTAIHSAVNSFYNLIIIFHNKKLVAKLFMSHLLSQESNGSISVYKDFWDKQIQ